MTQGYPKKSFLDSPVAVQSASIVWLQGFPEFFVEVPQASWPYYSCCAAKQEENCKRNLHINFLANLATKLLTHSVQ